MREIRGTAQFMRLVRCRNFCLPWPRDTKRDETRRDETRRDETRECGTSVAPRINSPIAWISWKHTRTHKRTRPTTAFITRIILQTANSLRVYCMSSQCYTYVHTYWTACEFWAPLRYSSFLSFFDSIRWICFLPFLLLVESSCSTENWLEYVPKKSLAE